MQKTKPLPLFPSQLAPVCPRRFQQTESSLNVRLDKCFRPANRAVHVTLGREVHNGAGPVLAQQFFHYAAIPNVALRKMVAPIACDAV